MKVFLKAYGKKILCYEVIIAVKFGIMQFNNLNVWMNAIFTTITFMCF